MQQSIDWITTNNALVSILIVFAALLARAFGIRAVRGSASILTADHRRRISNIHHLTVLGPLLLLLVIWLPQVREFALSITAIAVAIVIATKELLLCLLGSFLARTSRAFVIGDWIEVQGRFGEVIEQNLLGVKLQEIECRGFTCTGRTIGIPGAAFLGSSVVNQNFLRRYQFHAIHITIEPDAFPIDAERALEQRLRALAAPFAETARRYAAMLEKRTGIDIPDPEPQIEFSTSEIAKIVTTITLFCPTDRIVAIEKEMVREFFAWYRSNRGGAAPGASSVPALRMTG